MERIMMKIQALVVSAALAIGMAAPVLAANGDPEVIIYRFPGVFDDGGADNTGQATSFHCTNFSGANETIRFVTRGGPSGTLLTNVPLNINHLGTLTVSTHLTKVYNETLGTSLATGSVQQGTTAIAATTTSIICSAVAIDAANTPPTVAIPLRGIRFNPAPGSQE
jgi:hypothetical protein